jgi:hypothetical protein
MLVTDVKQEMKPMFDARLESWPMLVGAVAGVCAKYPVARKLLLVQDHQAGRLLLDACAAAAGGWLNLHAVTAFDLAWKAAMPKAAAKELEAADALSLECLVLAAYDAVPKKFFPPAPSFGLIAALSRVLSELRIAGITADDMAKNTAGNPSKNADLAALMKAYVKELRRNALLDEAGVYELAAGAVIPPDSFLLVPPSVRVTPRSRQFLLAWAGDRVIPVDDDPVVGLPPPAACWTLSATETAARPATALSFLYAPERNSLPASGIELFAAAGMRNEIREIFRRVVDGGIPFDDVEVVLADYASYASAFKDIADEIGGIRLTFGSGLPSLRSAAARCLSAFARWIDEDYPEPMLRRMFAGGDIAAPDDLSGQQTARVLRAARIGWGRDRYLPLLDSSCRALREEILAAAGEDGDRADRLRKRLDAAEKVRDHVRAIFDLLPEEKAPLSDWFAAAALFLENHARVRSESDAEVMNRLTSTLRSGVIETMPLSSRRELRLRLQAIAESAHTETAGASPGALHVVPLSAGGLSGRRHVFLPGLSETVYPGTIVNDPILGDEERRSLGGLLPESAETARTRAFLLGLALARTRGRVCMSYATSGLADGSRRFPSPLMLQAWRLVSGNPLAGYEELDRALEPVIGFLPESGGSGVAAHRRSQRAALLGPNEWWLSKIADRGVLTDARQSVLAAFPDLAAGHAAIEARASTEAGGFDGRLIKDAEFDIHASGRAVSATALETYAACPRKFFFSHLLRVESPDEIVREPGVWLDALNRGSLLHEFYFRFLSQLKAVGERRDPVRHRKRAEQVLDAVIAEWKTDVPPPSELVFTSERKELFDSIDVFLDEERLVPGMYRGVPEYFEISFGVGDAVPSADMASADPVEIELPGGGRIRVRGRIDRIDRLPQNNDWAVWDYKTGSAKQYAGDGYIAGGRQLQPVLYACVAEQILRKPAPDLEQGRCGPVVAVSGYLFTTGRSDGNVCVPRDSARRREGLRAIELLLGAMADGIFIGTGENCGYCDWAVCCHGDEADRWKALEETRDAAVLTIGEVHGYE